MLKETNQGNPSLVELFCSQLISLRLMLSLNCANRWGFLHGHPCSHLSIWVSRLKLEGLCLWQRSCCSSAFLRSLPAQSLHLPVHQPERMDLVCRLTDKQPAASCFQASPDNSNSTFSPQMDGLLNRCAENSLCVCFFLYVSMSVSFSTVDNRDKHANLNRTAGRP